MKKEPQSRLLTFLVVAHQLSADHHDAGHNKQQSKQGRTHLQPVTEVHPQTPSVAINEAEVG